MGRPWFSPSTAKSAGLGGVPPRVLVEGIEVTQAIQDMGHSVPLVAGKRTIVRVYLASESATPLNARGELTVGPSGSSVVVSSMNSVHVDPALNGQLRPKREDANASLNFLLPTSLILAGSRQVQLSRALSADTGNEIAIGGAAARTVTFHAGAPLRIRVLGIRYHLATSSAVFEPRQVDFDLLESWLRRAYPATDVIFSSLIIDSNSIWPFTADQVNAQLAAIRQLDMASGGDRRTHYYGLVFDGGVAAQFMRGKAAGIPQTPDPSTVASGPTGSSDFGWDGDGSYGDWYGGHELAHTFGRFHPGFCAGNSSDDPQFPFPNGQLSPSTGEFVGLDAGDSALGLPMRALPGVVWHDVMTYCDNQWMCSYTYDGIRTRLIAENALGLPAPPSGPAPSGATMTAANGGPPGGPDGDAINVVATVNLTRQTGHIEYVQPVNAAAVGVGLQQPSQGSGTELQFRDSSAAVLSRDSVELRLDSCPMPGEDRTGLVDVVIGKNPGVKFIDLLLNGKVLDTFAASPSGPSMSNLRANVKAAKGEIDVAWDAQQPTASTVTYSVQVSDDDGATWQTIAIRQPTPRYAIDAKQFSRGKTLRVRVIASDGFNSSVASSEDITLPPLQ